MRILCLIYFFLFIYSAGAQNSSREALEKKLSILKNQNNLTDWLYARMDYNAEKPGERILFLMSTAGEAWRKPQSQPEREAWLNLLTNQGYYQLYTGNVLYSIEEYEGAYAFYQKQPVNGFNLVEYIFKPLGNNYTRLGDYSNALFIQQKSLQIAKQKKDSSSIASIYNNLAISYKSMGNLEQAKRMCLTGFEYAHPQKSISGLLNSTLADIEFDQENYSAAAKSIRTALTVLSALKEDSYTAYWLLSCYTLAGNIEQQRANLAAALSFYQKGLRLIEQEFKGSRNREKAHLLTQTGNIALETKQGFTALNHFSKALQTLIPEYKHTGHSNLPPVKSLYGENRLYDALEGRANAFLLLNKHEDALNNFMLALKTGTLSRRHFSNDRDRLYYQKQSKILTERAINTAFNLWQTTRDEKFATLILSLSEQSKAQTLLDHIEQSEQILSGKNHPLLKKQSALKRAIVYYEKQYLLNKDPSILLNKQETQYKLSLLDKEIKKNYPSFNRAKAEDDLSGKKIIDSIPASTGVISFFWGQDNVYIIKLARGEIDTIIRQPHAKKLKADISNYLNTYFKAGPAAMANNPQTFFSASHSIYLHLLSKVFRYRKQENMVIIPDDVLGYLPFESLITSAKYTSDIAKWPYLIKAVPLSYAYSLQTWLKGSSSSSISGNTFSGFFISKSEGNADIPAVAEEASGLKPLIKGSFFLNEEATIKNFTHELKNSSVLHLSTHSFLWENEPVLQLSNGKFFLFELSAQTQVPQLVVLSACRTADGILAPGEGVLSLSRGFTAAGTTGVVAGLWNINDAASAQLITCFYQNLKNSKDAATALHQAKLDWLNQNHSNQAQLLPYYWSSLIYIGKPQTVSIQQPKKIYWILVTIILLIMSGYLIRKK
ncbi:MAG: CHAT domain-containing protein [Sphingobacteriaceae bacterium]|nr:CHAT domain-containing protein [Sphingobacteriaceae bacterium]